MKKLINLILSLVPSRLPIGVAEFETWAQSINQLLGPGFKEVPFRDIKYMLATMVMHLGPQRNLVPRFYFVRSLQKAAANQVAGQIFQQVKSEQEAEVKKQQEQATHDAAQQKDTTTEASPAKSS